MNESARGDADDDDVDDPPAADCLARTRRTHRFEIHKSRNVGKTTPFCPATNSVQRGSLYSAA